MKKFIKKTIVFCLPVMVFLTVIEAVVRMAPNDYKYKWSYLGQHFENIEILVLGNSQSYYGIDCNLFQHGAFNMAMEGQGLLIDEYILNTFIHKMKNLKVVIIPLSYLSMTQPEAFGSPGRLTQYHIYYNYDSTWYSIDNYECLNPFSCREKIKSLVKCEGLRHVDSLGCFAHPSDSFHDDAGETLAWTTQGDVTLFDDNYHSILRMTHLCQDVGSNLVLLSFPTDTSYRNSSLFSVPQTDRVNSIASVLSVENDCVHWLNWFENPAFDRSDFFDSSHLNHKGATKLSLMLSSFMLNEQIFTCSEKKQTE